MAQHDARAVANEILKIAREKRITVTVMKLVKLVYLANAWWLTYNDGKPLTSTEAEAWQYGPVHRDVYYAFANYGSRPITKSAQNPETGFEYMDTFTDQEKALMTEVVDAYGYYHAFRLSSITHKEGTPWSKTVDEKGMYTAISNEIVKKHYDELKNRTGATS